METRLEALKEYLSYYLDKNDLVKINTLFTSIKTTNTSSITLNDNDTQKVYLAYFDGNRKPSNPICKRVPIPYYGEVIASVRYCIDHDWVRSMSWENNKWLFLLILSILLPSMIAILMPLYILNRRIIKLIKGLSSINIKDFTSTDLLEWGKATQYPFIKAIIKKFSELFQARELLNKELSEKTKLAAIGTATSIISRDSGSLVL